MTRAITLLRSRETTWVLTRKELRKKTTVKRNVMHLTSAFLFTEVNQIIKQNRYAEFLYFSADKH